MCQCGIEIEIIGNMPLVDDAGAGFDVKVKVSLKQYKMCIRDRKKETVSKSVHPS